MCEVISREQLACIIFPNYQIGILLKYISKVDVGVEKTKQKKAKKKPRV